MPKYYPHVKKIMNWLRISVMCKKNKKEPKKKN